MRIQEKSKWKRNGANQINGISKKKVTKIEPTKYNPTHGATGIPIFAAFQITANVSSNIISSLQYGSNENPREFTSHAATHNNTGDRYESFLCTSDPPGNKGAHHKWHKSKERPHNTRDMVDSIWQRNWRTRTRRQSHRWERNEYNFCDDAWRNSEYPLKQGHHIRQGGTRLQTAERRPMPSAHYSRRQLDKI